MDSNQSYASNTSNINSDNDRNRIKKTRHRIPTTCAVCRKRKMKCDKSRPFCGACIRNNTTQYCIYEDQPWAIANEIQKLKNDLNSEKKKNQQLNQQIQSLRKSELNLMAALSHTRKLSDSNSSSSISLNSGTTTGSSISNPQEAFISFDIFTAPKVNQSHHNDFGNSNDPLVELSKKFDMLVIKESKLMHFGPTSYMAMINNDMIVTRVFNKYLQDQQKKYFNLKKSLDLTGANLKDPNVTFCANLIPEDETNIFDPNKSPSYDLVIKGINDLLPPKSVVDGLLDRFFNVCYQTFPIIDKSLFYESLDQVLKIDYTRPNSYMFKVPDKSYLSTLCNFLIMLRVAFLSTNLKPTVYSDFSTNDNVPAAKISNSNSNGNGNGNSEEIGNYNYDKLTYELSLNKTVVGPIYIEHAKNCIAQASTLRKTTFRSVQALLLLRMYRYYSPEDGDEGADSTVLLAMIIQMAKMVGLHRDPNQFSLIEDERVKHVWRKMWFKLLRFDAFHSFMFGVPLSISDDNQWDTEIPYLKASNILSSDPSETFVIRFMNLEYEVTTVTKKVMVLCSNCKTSPKRSEINECNKLIDNILNYKIQSFQELIDSVPKLESNDSFSNRIHEICHKCHEFCLRDHLLSVKYILNYILFLTCESHETELQEKYLAASVECALIMFKVAYDYSHNTSELFGGRFEMLLAPSVFVCAQRAFQLIGSFIIRIHTKLTNFDELKLYEFKSKDSKGLYEWLVNGDKRTQLSSISASQGRLDLSKRLFKYVEEMYYCTLDLSKRYFVSWRLSKLIQMYISYLIEIHPEFKLICRSKNLKGDDEEVDNNPVNPTSPESELGDEFQKFLNSINQSEFDPDDDIMMDNIDSNYWSNLMDEAGQIRFDYLNPVIDGYIRDPFVLNTSFQNFDDLAFKNNISDLNNGNNNHFNFENVNVNDLNNFGYFNDMNNIENIADITHMNDVNNMSNINDVRNTNNVNNININMDTNNMNDLNINNINNMNSNLGGLENVHNSSDNSAIIHNELLNSSNSTNSNNLDSMINTLIHGNSLEDTLPGFSSLPANMDLRDIRQNSTAHYHNEKKLKTFSN
ncbi:uncharacterized protein ASCRUDRAFT_55435 [Ascoidea rubescens DSM 1968]|uniref:Zn(2)-C6 fungal-type domain-containing protein n=1 Tax=Ascoidea rubescens DSM 1968 TaxID=1344418 RepID=A0A1D2VL10_9ASCO|nr:hypothetical protein ASCRUDRAFT_55435 [Ascoidea rubescens DSM 1968]ODV62300.1 hypothetical protein ASCRUDRAFT_55435 [Ascoidea rubescens DSM 1968]